MEHGEGRADRLERYAVLHTNAGNELMLTYRT